MSFPLKLFGKRVLTSMLPPTMGSAIIKLERTDLTLAGANAETDIREKIYLNFEVLKFE